MAGFEDFNAMSCPLTGTALIEAGAGTGKTYTITSLYLRLILEKKLTVDNILVVTFTKAATEEIRDRTRRKLREGVEAISSVRSDDPFLSALLEGQPDLKAAAQRLKEALRAFDEAAIFTIHGFCQRVLQESAFETGCLFDTELITDDGALKQEVAQDFWRSNLYQADPDFVGYALASGLSPASFLKKAGPSALREGTRILPALGDCKPEGLEAVKETFERLKEAWAASKEEAMERLMDPGVKGNAYGTLKPLEGGPSKRERLIAGLAADMERFLCARSPALPLFKGFEKLTARFLSSNLKKGAQPVAHPLFELCESLQDQADALAEAFDRAVLALHCRFFEYLKQGLPERKRVRNIRSFDDLLTDLREALNTRGGSELIESVRSRYDAALIDEFQDTDPIQYHIFRTLFGTADRPLFLIGDPKQAIYSFRGADLFTYMQAAREASRRYTLRKNWRSEPGLLTAVNAIFSLNDRPFLYDAIQFPPAVPAENEKEALFVQGEEPSPFHLWLLDEREGDGPSKPCTKERARQLIPQATAAEISRLVRLGREGKALIGRSPLREKDIAVLVRTNKEGSLLQRTFETFGIRSVLFSTGNLFDSPEAAEMERVLSAVAFPEREAVVRGALSSALFGLNGEQLERLSEDEGAWDEILERFRDYHDLWQRQGFYTMFRRLLSNEDVGPRLLAYPDGERRMTNFLHLAEVLHREAHDRHLGMSGSLKWLAEQRDPDAPRLEAHQLRLESDEEAVKIVTIHKSKGLEYPVVFCPFSWAGSEVRNGEIFFHDEEEGHCPTLDLGSPEMEAHKALAEKELLAENLRLLYVALTRAKNRCYFVWGPIKGAETSAPAYLIHGPASPEPIQEVTSTGRRFAGLSREEMLRELNRLVERSEGTITVSDLPTPSAPSPIESADPDSRLAGRVFSGGLSREWKVSSFSSLVSGRLISSDLPDRDALPSPSEAAETDGGDERPFSDILSFPRGLRTGNFLHDLMENLKFEEEDASVREALALEKLKQYGFEHRWLQAVSDMLGRVLSAPLGGEEPSPKLKEVRLEDRLSELEFYFPLKRISREDLIRVFQAHAAAAVGPDFPEALERLQFAPTRGFMKGYIDLVFRWRGRFYLVDWKSNYLGAATEDYSREALADAMEKEYYLLQYHIYSVALDQYLRLRLPGYRYEAHFGGCFYVFLRGLDPEKGRDCGVYSDLPSPHLIEALREALLDV